METVLLTGITGFLGSHLARNLLEKNYRVIGTKRSTSRLDRLSDVLARLTLYDVDAVGPEEIFRREPQIDSIIHTATAYGRKGETVGEIIEANLMVPLQLLELGIKNSVRRFLNVDTVLEAGTNAYAMSKHQFSEWGQYFAHQSANLQFINAKMQHFYGPRDDETKFVTKVIATCLRNEPELKLTEGDQKRDFLYISDAVDALYVLLTTGREKDGYVEYEVGSGEVITIRSLVTEIHRLTHSRTHLAFGAIPYRPQEPAYLCADVSGLKELGWRQSVDIQKGLLKTIESVRSGQ